MDELIKPLETAADAISTTASDAVRKLQDGVDIIRPIEAVAEIGSLAVDVVTLAGEVLSALD